MSDAPQRLLAHHLKALKLPTVLHQLGLDGIEQFPVHDRGVLTRIAAVPMVEFTDVHAILKEVAERASAQGNAADRFPGCQHPSPRHDTALTKLGQQGSEAAYVHVPFEYHPDRRGFRLVDDQLAIFEAADDALRTSPRRHALLTSLVDYADQRLLQRHIQTRFKPATCARRLLSAPRKPAAHCVVPIFHGGEMMNVAPFVRAKAGERSRPG